VPLLMLQSMHTMFLLSCDSRLQLVCVPLQTYFVSRQHRRAVMLLKHHGLMEDVRFRSAT
jgi:hypothetical protein